MLIYIQFVEECADNLMLVFNFYCILWVLGLSTNILICIVEEKQTLEYEENYSSTTAAPLNNP